MDGSLSAELYRKHLVLLAHLIRETKSGDATESRKEDAQDSLLSLLEETPHEPSVVQSDWGYAFIPLIIGHLLDVACAPKGAEIRKRALRCLVPLLEAIGTAELLCGCFPGVVSALRRIITAKEVSTGGSVRAAATNALKAVTLQVCSDSTNVLHLPLEEEVSAAEEIYRLRNFAPVTKPLHRATETVVETIRIGAHEFPRTRRSAAWLIEVGERYAAVAHDINVALSSCDALRNVIEKPQMREAVTEFTSSVVLSCPRSLRSALPFLVEMWVLVETGHGSTFEGGVAEQIRTVLRATCWERVLHRAVAVLLCLPAKVTGADSAAATLQLASGYVNAVLRARIAPEVLAVYGGAEGMCKSLLNVTRTVLPFGNFAPGRVQAGYRHLSTALAELQHPPRTETGFMPAVLDERTCCELKRLCHAIARWSKVDIELLVHVLLAVLQDWDRWRDHLACVFLLSHLVVFSQTTLSECFSMVTVLLDEFLNESLWNISSVVRAEGKIEGNLLMATPGSTQSVEETRHRQQLLGLMIEGVANCAVSLFHREEERPTLRYKQLFVQRALYPLLEHLAAESPQIRTLAGEALDTIARAMGYGKGVADLVARNTDYLIDDVTRKLQYVHLYRNTPAIYAAVLRASTESCGTGGNADLIVMVGNTLPVVLTSLDKHRSDPDLIHAFLCVLRAMAHLLVPEATKHTGQLRELERDRDQQIAASSARFAEAEAGAEIEPMPEPPEKDERPPCMAKDHLTTILQRLPHFLQNQQVATTAVLLTDVAQTALDGFAVVGPPYEDKNISIPRFVYTDHTVNPLLHAMWTPLLRRLLPSGYTVNEIGSLLPGGTVTFSGAACLPRTTRLPAPEVTAVTVRTLEHLRYLIYQHHDFLEHRMQIELWPVLRYYLCFAEDLGAGCASPSYTRSTTNFRMVSAILRWAALAVSYYRGVELSQQAFSRFNANKIKGFVNSVAAASSPFAELHEFADLKELAVLVIDVNKEISELI
eukprot:TRINITY_DN11180_c0_g1_i1.p1 TRINITY_DN11180_c0_g1~~TRINITY_DN11180_c0_g1_i1.p1  ORF type:complete len:992 (-),score=131.29 TRINITY_DN11180_c0_g1_i1:28-3003(-)